MAVCFRRIACLLEGPPRGWRDPNSIRWDRDTASPAIPPLMHGPIRELVRRRLNQA